MIQRRLIGSILLTALMAGSAIVPLARAACAGSMAKAPACPSCASLPESDTPRISMDRSCCAAPAISERDPATFASARSAEHRALAMVVIVPAARVLVDATERVVGITSDPPASSPPILRTTILLI